MKHLLLLSLRGNARGPMAQGLAQLMVNPRDVRITNAGLDAAPLDRRAIAVMKEIGIDVTSPTSLSFSLIDSITYDVVIALSEHAAVQCAALPGAPTVIRWNVPDPLADGESANLDSFRTVRDELKKRLEAFFTGGYLDTITSLTNNFAVMLDHLTEGIIVHDLHRRITWFNRAAERITGFSRQEVIGRPCNEIFEGGFCGGKCSFTGDIPQFENLQYPLKFITRDGRSCRLDMSVVPMLNEKGDFQGVIASFRDITEVTHLRQQLKTVQSFHGIIGSDAKMQILYELISDLAVSDCPVLIQGESGTGKELVAGAIHGESRRAGLAYVTVNCGALPEGILESELFGHVKGAFTGAIRDKKGRFELADGGTIFLDEVGELSPNIQVKLLRVLQEGTFYRVGGDSPIKVDVRLISATNRDLREMVRKGQFREDLYYRLCVFPVILPPLRERRNDIPLLINHFMERFGKNIDRPIHGISSQSQNCMIDYPWPGNIRELQNAIQYAFVKCKTGVIQVGHLPPEIITFIAEHPSPETLVTVSKGKILAYGRPRKLELQTIKQAVKKTNGNKVRAAQLLGIGRATLYRYLKEQEKGE